MTSRENDRQIGRCRKSIWSPALTLPGSGGAQGIRSGSRLSLSGAPCPLSTQHCGDRNSRCRSEMNVQAAWKRGYTGKNVVVTILDDGIERNHPDLAANYVSWPGMECVAVRTGSDPLKSTHAGPGQQTPQTHSSPLLFSVTVSGLQASFIVRVPYVTHKTKCRLKGRSRSP